MQLNDVKQALSAFLLENPLNKVEALGNLRIFGEPLVGIAAADDQLFARLKEPDAVGPHHMSPKEWLPEGQAVISYFLPFTKEVREANRKPGLPAREWLHGRIEGEELNNLLRPFLLTLFKNDGYDALCPVLDKRFSVVSRRSNWSERHVAYIAGLGTFSLSRSLITKAGSAGRLGSIVVSASIEPTSRYYDGVDDNCTRCGACIYRCPPLAIAEAGKDNGICGEYLDRVLALYKPRYGCGKCQTGVPCEDKIPTKH